MRRLVVGVVTVGLLCAAGPALGSHASSRYCSESGDLCQSTRKIDGIRKLAVTTTDGSLATYGLCVTTPTGRTDCKRFEMEPSGDDYADSVRWHRHFPADGPGHYKVAWKIDDCRVIGEELGFSRG